MQVWWDRGIPLFLHTLCTYSQLLQRERLINGHNGVHYWQSNSLYFTTQYKETNFSFKTVTVWVFCFQGLEQYSVFRWARGPLSFRLASFRPVLLQSHLLSIHTQPPEHIFLLFSVFLHVSASLKRNLLSSVLVQNLCSVLSTKRHLSPEP